MLKLDFKSSDKNISNKSEQKIRIQNLLEKDSLAPY